MERKNTQRLSDILPQVLEKQHLAQRLDETEVCALWSKLFGEAVTRYTTSARIRNGVLYVSLSSAILRNELMSCKEALIERLNEEMGRTIVKNIIFR